MTEARAHADELNRFWNTLLAGEADDAGFALAADEADLIRRLQRAGKATQVHMPADRAWPAVLARIAAQPAEDAMTQTHVLTAPAFASAPNGRISSAPLTAARTLRPWSWRSAGNVLATAALIILVLAGSLVALGPLGGGWSNRLPVLPAISGIPTAESGIVTETLLDETVPERPAERAAIYLGYHRLEAGVSFSEPRVVGTYLVAVEQGTAEITSSEESRILTSGERFVAPSTDGIAIVNIGEDEARVISLLLQDAVATSAGENSASTGYSDPQKGESVWPLQVSATLPAGPSQVILERVTLPSGAALPPYAATDLDWVGIGAGRLGITLAGAQLPFRWDPGEEQTYGNFEGLPSIRAGTEVALRNAGDDPLVLYRLAVRPRAAATPTAAVQPEITTETLIEGAVAPMTAGHAQILVNVITLQPGVSGGLDGQVGTVLHAVEAGTVTVVLSGAEREIHAGEQWGGPVDGISGIRNTGPEEARLVELDILDAVATSTSPGNDNSPFTDPLGFSARVPVEAGATLPAGPLWTTLERLTLPPGATLPAYTATGLDWLGIDAGRVGVALEGERLPFRWDSGEERTYSAGEPLPAIAAGARVTLRNAGDDPLVLYRVALTSLAAATPAS
jgi:hypothetical protein